MAAIKTRTVPALDKAIGILELLTQSRGGLSLPELVEEAKLPKSSVHYLLVTLERRGYVERSERTGRYLLGHKLFVLANSALAGLGLSHFAMPHLSALRMRTGLTVHMAILDQHEAVVIAKQAAPRDAVASWVGKRMELHCTGLGKVLLAYQPREAIDRILGQHRLGRHNENTIVNPQRLREDLLHVEQMGYALDDEEDEIGVRCIGMPVFSKDLTPVAAISLAGTTNEICPENFTVLISELKRASAAMCSQIRTLAAVA